MTLKFGLIGTGWFGEKHAKLLAGHKDVELVAVTGTSKEKADKLATQLPNAIGYEDANLMFEQHKLDAVYICTPPFARGQFELSCIERGIPFLVEKPLSTEPHLPRQLNALIKEKNLITSVGYHFRYMDGTDKLISSLAQAQIAMAAGFWMGGAPGGTWWRREEKSGGQLVEQTTHLVDLLRYVAGEVTEVYAAYSNGILTGQDANANVSDAGTVTLKFQSGAVATINNTCVLPFGEHVGLSLYTDKGRFEVTHKGFKGVTSSESVEYLNVNNPYERQMEAFIHALKTGDRSLIRSSYEDSCLTHDITMAANESAKSGKVISLV